MLFFYEFSEDISLLFFMEFDFKRKIRNIMYNNSQIIDIMMKYAILLSKASPTYRINTKRNCKNNHTF